MQHIKLYSTSGCSLCEQLLDRLLSLPAFSGCSLEVIDIAQDDRLLDRLAERIPVVEIGEMVLEGRIEDADLIEALGRATAPPG